MVVVVAGLSVGACTGLDSADPRCRWNTVSTTMVPNGKVFVLPVLERSEPDPQVRDELPGTQPASPCSCCSDE